MTDHNSATKAKGSEEMVDVFRHVLTLNQKRSLVEKYKSNMRLGVAELQSLVLIRDEWIKKFVKSEAELKTKGLLTEKDYLDLKEDLPRLNWCVEYWAKRGLKDRTVPESVKGAEKDVEARRIPPPPMEVILLVHTIAKLVP
ncbi:hypothetical protein K469DRAFT_693488 [Zopfia rhizophila CBS 207.26]|uniref:Uncharacterized protein n=1 Tax=Zopfia rhizophila CBS 207.26 TaxID=1314779 RepID=A0A6A6DQT8_9PEZI|nr:hypothetical protein K469DRAFT_693488 [Zopfia rhizophila CBS 207.26]